MNDEQARCAYNAYLRTIRIYRRPERAPEFFSIMRALSDADEYYRSIPHDEIKHDQFVLAGKIRSILIGRKHGVSTS